MYKLPDSNYQLLDTMQRFSCLEKLTMLGKVEGKKRKGRSPAGWMESVTLEMGVEDLQGQTGSRSS